VLWRRPGRFRPVHAGRHFGRCEPWNQEECLKPQYLSGRPSSLVQSGPGTPHLCRMTWSQPHPIANAIINCLVVQGKPSISGPPPTKTVSSTRTNSQGGFECNFRVSLETFDKAERSALCGFYKVEGLAVSFEGDQNYFPSGHVYGFAKPGHEGYERESFHLCPAGTSPYTGSNCPSNCRLCCE